MKALKVDGGNQTVLADLFDVNRAYEPYAIVVDYNNVYWTNIAQGSVMFLPLSGEIPDGGPSQLSQFHEQPYWLAVSQDALYWTDFGVSSNGSVWRFVFDGGYDGGDCLASGQLGASGIALDSNTLYWTNQYGGQVLSLPLVNQDAGRSEPGSCSLLLPAPNTLADLVPSPFRITVDAKSVYWTSSENAPILGKLWQFTPK